MDTDAFTLALQKQLADRRRLADARVEKLYTRRNLEQGFLECFELVGGVPRLAMWANETGNYGEFLKLLIKFAPKEGEKEGGNTINFLSSVPDSPLNYPMPDHDRPRLDHDAEDADISEDF